jgi:hypothetical protein
LPVTQKEEVEVKRMVQDEFSDAPAMIRVAACESRYRQFKDDGSLLYNLQGSSAVGVFQIMESIHYDNAVELGYDIHSVEGNIGYARHLYDTDGIGHWNASRHCWQTNKIAQKAP